MKVTLLGCPRNPLKEIWTQARGCYSKHDFATLYSEKYPGDEKALPFVLDRLQEEHWSITRGVWFKFSLAEVSRSCSHQLVRHVVGVAWEQQSARYCKIDVTNSDWHITPKSIASSVNWHDYESCMRISALMYEKLIANGIPAEDARFVLPHAHKTNLIGTFSFEALSNFLGQRLCTLAQWEIRDVAKQMRHEVVQRFPWSKDIFTIKCMPHRQCWELRGKGCPLAHTKGGNVLWMHDERVKQGMKDLLRELKNDTTKSDDNGIHTTGRAN